MDNEINQVIECNATEFDGPKNILFGVKGILQVENGGTGKNSLALVTVTDLDDDSDKIATTAFVAAIIRRLMGATPDELNTLQELAVAVNNDPNYATTIAKALSDLDSRLKGQSSAYVNPENNHIWFDSKERTVKIYNDTTNQWEIFVAKPVEVSITIPKTGWKLDSAETSDYKYYYEISVSGLTTKDIVEIFYSRKSIETVLEAGICSSDNEAMTSKFRIYAAAVPTAPINANYVVWKG